MLVVDVQRLDNAVHGGRRGCFPFRGWVVQGPVFEVGSDRPRGLLEALTQCARRAAAAQRVVPRPAHLPPVSAPAESRLRDSIQHDHISHFTQRTIERSERKELVSTTSPPTWLRTVYRQSTRWISRRSYKTFSKRTPATTACPARSSVSFDFFIPLLFLTQPKTSC